MTTKTITINELTFFASNFLRVWNEEKSQITVKGKSLFHLIGLKKEIEKHLAQSQEGVALLAEQCGGIFKQEIGGFEIPPENQVEANKAIGEFGRTEVMVHYTPIVVGVEDIIPIELLDLIFDYIELAE